VKYVLQSPYSTQRREASDAGRVRLAITGGAAFVGTNLALSEGIERTVAWHSEGRDWWAPFTALIRAEREGPGFLLDRVFPI
jgi:hypothetical protein